jgi:hypothetical protein
VFFEWKYPTRGFLGRETAGRVGFPASFIFSGLKALVLRSRALKAGENQLVRSGGSVQTLVRLSYYITRLDCTLGNGNNLVEMFE